MAETTIADTFEILSTYVARMFYIHLYSHAERLQKDDA